MQNAGHITAVLEGLHSRIARLETLNAKIKPAKPKNKPDKIPQNTINLRKLQENSPELYQLYQCFHSKKLSRKRLQFLYGIDGSWAIDEFSKSSVFGFGHIDGDELEFSITPYVEVFGVDDMLKSIEDIGSRNQKVKQNPENVFGVDDMLSSIKNIDQKDNIVKQKIVERSRLFELQVFEDPDYTSLSKNKYISDLGDIKDTLNKLFKWVKKENIDENGDLLMNQDIQDDSQDDDELLQRFQKSASLHHSDNHKNTSLIDFLHGNY